MQTLELGRQTEQRVHSTRGETGPEAGRGRRGQRRQTESLWDRIRQHLDEPVTSQGGDRMTQCPPHSPQAGVTEPVSMWPRLAPCLPSLSVEGLEGEAGLRKARIFPIVWPVTGLRGQCAHCPCDPGWTEPEAHLQPFLSPTFLMLLGLALAGLHCALLVGHITTEVTRGKH